MTVYELIQQLQDCDKPDAEIRLVVEVADDVRIEYLHPVIKEVFYSSLVSNTVVVRAGEVK